MKKILQTLFLTGIIASSQAQNVGIGTNTPNASAKLDITSTNSGVLIPRVSLTMTTVAAPVAAPANSLLVYNTATAGDVTPGFYYWSTTANAWIRMAEGLGWLTTGNNGIGATNFLGPINAADLNFRTTNSERMKITAAGLVGINTSIPATYLDINGDLAYREGTALALANGANSNLAIGATSYLRVTGPTAAFSITGITGGVNGKIVTLVNSTTFPMTIAHDITSTAANRIYTPGAAPLVIDVQYGTVTLQYNSTLSRWIVVSYSKKDGSDWLLVGNTGINDPAAPAIYGTSPIAATENWLGTTDANDLVLGTNNIERFRVKQTNGYIGIGTAAPAASTEIYANTTVPVPHLLLRENDNDYARLSFMNTNTNSKYWTNSAILNAITDGSSVWNVYYNNGAGTNILSVTGNNRVGVMVNQAPNTTFDVNGDIAWREGTALALVNGINSNIAIGTTSYLRVTGPTAAFSITGIVGGVNGKIVTLINTSTFPMTISHDITSVATNRIYTPGASPLVIDVQYGTVTLQYNSTLGRWVVVSYSKKDGADWLLVGNAGINDPAAPVTYGISTITATENWMGTTDANDVVFGTNYIERMRIKQTSGNVGIGTAAPTEQLHVYEVNNADKSTINSYASQTVTGTDYENRAVVGIAKGGSATWGYAIGVTGVADQANSWYSTGVYAGLGTVAPSSIARDQALYADGASLGYSGIFMNGFVGMQAPAPSEQLEIGGTDAKIYMNSAGSNMLSFNTSGVAAPAFTTRSVGTKLILYPQVSATSTDYAIGITGSTQWYSIPEAISAYSFRWYSGITEQMRFRGDGRLGIGITAPTATRLQAYDPSTGTARIAIFRNGNADGTEVQVGSVEYLHDYASTTDFNDGVNTVGLTINYNASSGYDLQLANNAAAKPTSNAWTIVSDARLKEDIHPFKDGLATLRQINPIYYKYNGQANTPTNEYGIGILAQEMQKIAPYTVGTWEYLPDESNKSNIEEYLSYNSHALDYVAINAIKELDAKQSRVEAVYKNISDFGMTTLNAEETFIPFGTDFRHNLDANIQPVVTLTPIGNNVTLSIIEQTTQGFKVKMVGNNGAPVQVNWIAMAKVNSNALNTTTEYTEAERQEMLNKVKLPTTRLRKRIEREEQELKKFKAELEAANALESKMPKMPNQDAPIVTPELEKK